MSPSVISQTANANHVSANVSRASVIRDHVSNVSSSNPQTPSGRVVNVNENKFGS